MKRLLYNLLFLLLGPVFVFAHPLDEGRSAQEITLSVVTPDTETAPVLQVFQRFIFDETITTKTITAHDTDDDGTLSSAECRAAADTLHEWAADTLDLRIGAVDDEAFALLKEHYKARFNLFAAASNLIQTATHREITLLLVEAKTLRAEIHVLSRFALPDTACTAVLRNNFKTYFSASTIRSTLHPRLRDTDIKDPEAIPFTDPRLFRQTFASLPKKRFALFQLGPKAP